MCTREPSGRACTPTTPTALLSHVPRASLWLGPPAPDNQAGILPRAKEAGPPAKLACCAHTSHPSDAGWQQWPRGLLLFGGQAAIGWHQGSGTSEPPRLKPQQPEPSNRGGPGRGPGLHVLTVGANTTCVRGRVCAHVHTGCVRMSLGLGCPRRFRNVCICADHSLRCTCRWE